MPPEVPTTMSVVEISSPGGPEVLRLVQRPAPQSAPNEVLLQVMAAGVNRLDLMQRRGLYPPPPGVTDLPGVEVAGIVFRRGTNVTSLKIGDHVCALVAGGGYAEYCAAPPRRSACRSRVA